MLFLGVDGGGTKTIAALVDENGNLIGLGFSGPCNILENGEEVVRKNLREAVAPFKETLRKHKEQVFSCFGLPAVGEFRNSQEIMGNILKQELVIEPNIVVNDVVVGWAAGTLTRDGVHVVAGTGAIIYGRKGNQEVRVSGWGSLIGDEGSAYDIGRMAINIVTKQLDGRLSESLLKELLMKEYKFKDEIDLLEWVYKDPTSRRQRMASVAPVVYKAALEGDFFANKILDTAAKELATAAITAVKRLSLIDPLFSYSGSVLERNNIVKEKFRKILLDTFPTATVRKSSLPPVLGAILLAYKTTKGIITEKFLENLKNIVKDLENYKKPLSR
jgi:N-acetylglucosamine kinase-like BadF-type ATPase